MSTELIYSDATRLAELIRTREVSPVEVMKAHLDRIEAVNPRVNAIVTIVEDALESARKAEAAVQRGDAGTSARRALHGKGFDRHRNGADPTWNADLQRKNTRHGCDQRCAPEESRGHSACEDQSS